MHPAYSVILFTTASGAGYGLLFWLALLRLAGVPAPGGWLGAVALTLALALVSVGLLSSLAHLGRPERAHRAVTQWRSSWLSREGVAALATYVPAGLWWLLSLVAPDSGAIPILAVLSAVGAVATVWCTGMIYASLRTIRQWHRPEVVPVYLANAAATGALLLLVLFVFAGGGTPVPLALATLAALGVAAALKLVYWRRIDAAEGDYSIGQALGLGATAQVRPLDPPHTQPNFVMREMGYAVARRHARKLRRLALLALVAGPAALTVLALVAEPFAPVLLLLAVGLATVGVFIERWLFFAEAEHVSMLYYGRQRA